MIFERCARHWPRRPSCSTLFLPKRETALTTKARKRRGVSPCERGVPSVLARVVDRPGDPVSEPLMTVEMLTYDELADRLSISPEAARSLAKRLQLPRAVSIDGRARVTIDPAAIEHKPRPPVSRKTRIESLQTQIARLEATAATLRADFERERDRADRLTAALLKAAAETSAAREATARLEGEVTALRACAGAEPESKLRR